MGEMIERVAKAIEKAFESEGRVFDAGQAEDLARAAVEAMREPKHEVMTNRNPSMAATHHEAMSTILNAAGVSALSYEEAIGVYLRLRGILKDGFDGTPGKPLGARIPADWEPARNAST